MSTRYFLWKFREIIPSHYADKLFSASILELNWNQYFIDKRAKLKICSHVLTSSTQRQNVVQWTRTATKSTKMKNTRAKAKN